MGSSRANIGAMTSRLLVLGWLALAASCDSAKGCPDGSVVQQGACVAQGTDAGGAIDAGGTGLPCDPTSTIGGGCGEGQGCVLVIGAGTTMCSPASYARQGMQCPERRCAPGFQCVRPLHVDVGQCKRICRLSDDCSALDVLSSCVEAQPYGFETFGVCDR